MKNLFETKLTEEEINILLNQAFLENKEPIIIKYPPLNIDLFRIDLKRNQWKAKLTASEKEYKEKRDEIERKVGKEIKNEIPKYHELRSILIATGIFDHEKYGKDLQKTIKKLKSSPKEYVIALDTNLLYNNFVQSTLHPIIKQNKETQHKVNWLLSKLVEKEVGNKTYKKYDEKQIENFKKLGGNVFNELFNQPNLKRRKSMIATKELKYLREEIGIQKTNKKEWNKEKPDWDEIIVQDYKEATNKQERKSILFTFDKDQQNTGEIHNVKTCILNLPNPHEKGQINHKNLHQLIINLAQKYGIIQLKGTGAKALGTWKGMNYNKFYKNTIKIKYEQNTKIAKKTHNAGKTSQNLKNKIT